MVESSPSHPGFAENKAATLVVQMMRAVEQTTELLEAANGLHQKLLELHGSLTEPLLDLEALLREAAEQVPKQATPGPGG
jgi:hypothetical protein